MEDTGLAITFQLFRQLHLLLEDNPDIRMTVILFWPVNVDGDNVAVLVVPGD